MKISMDADVSYSTHDLPQEDKLAWYHHDHIDCPTDFKLLLLTATAIGSPGKDLAAEVPRFAEMGNRRNPGQEHDQAAD